MDYKIEDIEGIGPAYKEKLAKVGIGTTQQLLEQCGGKTGRKKVSEATEISAKLLLTWANMADMMRINGVGPQFAELLEAAGVDTIKELRTRNVANLTAKMAEVQEAKRICKAAPAESQVAKWIEAAKGMEPTISH